MVRLSDVAARAGTSLSTVSIVLSDRPSLVRISEKTRRAVLDAARDLGYTPNLAARRLRGGSAHLKSIILAIAYPLDSRLSLITRIVKGVQDQLYLIHEELENLGVSVQLTIETFELGNLARLRGLHEPFWFNGLVVTNTSLSDDAYVDTLMPSVPMVLFQRESPHSFVNTDNVRVGQLATEHLVDLGHRRIGLVYPAASASRAQAHRIQGYRAALAQAGLIPGPEEPATGVNWAEDAYLATERILDLPRDRQPTAIFATNDLLAIGAMRSIRDRGRLIPDDVALVGCDDAEFAAYQDPPLSTVHLPLEEMAARATTILLDLIYQRVEPPVQCTFPSRLVIRGSTERKEVIARSSLSGHYLPGCTGIQI
ncbi:MAG TPA: LacI family DNA-binding transcriptional regulator [Chloroflexota bacterium]|nr:LacI family DNA-binding transcriptional regulator [Chloroflexota bacterium]